jgi:hypothetical protein
MVSGLEYVHSQFQTSLGPMMQMLQARIGTNLNMKMNRSCQYLMALFEHHTVSLIFKAPAGTSSNSPPLCLDHANLILIILKIATNHRTVNGLSIPSYADIGANTSFI